MLRILPTCGFFSGAEVHASNPCGHLKTDVPWQMCCYCSLNPSRPPLATLLDPNAQAAIARQALAGGGLGRGCAGCGDPGGAA
jgi:hypothetical protein